MGLKRLLPALALASVCCEGCWQPWGGLKTVHVEAEGYVVPLDSPYTPRQLQVQFASGTSEADAEAAIAATGSTVLGHVPLSTYYVIQTPLGKSLQEVTEEIESNVSVSATVLRPPDPDAIASYRLMAEDGSALLHELIGSPELLQPVALEYIVRIRGRDEPDCIPVVVVDEVEILRDRVVQKHGTMTLVDRGSEGVVVILIEDSGDAYELLGNLADEISALPDIDGAGITVDGCERPVCLTSRAGGLEFRVTSYLPDP